MRKFLFTMLGIGFVSAFCVPTAHAGTSSATLTVGCHVGGSQKVCVYPLGQINAGQTYRLDYRNVQNDIPIPMVEYCFSTEYRIMSGYCGRIQWLNPPIGPTYTGTYSIPATNKNPYTYVNIRITVEGEATNNNDFEGTFTTTSRWADNNGATMAPTTIVPNGATSTLTGKGANAWSSFVNDPEKGATQFPIDPNDVYSSFTKTYTYTSGATLGVRTLQWCVHGPLKTGPPIFGGGEGDICTDVSVTVKPPLPTVDLKCDATDGPCAVNAGAASVLSWTSEDATSCNLTGPGTFSLSGTSNTGVSTGPLSVTDNVYTVTCTNAAGTATDTVTVNLNLPTISIQCRSSAVGATPAGAWGNNCTTNYNTNVDVRWSSSLADSCKALGAWSGDKALTGQENNKGPIKSPTAFTIQCNNVGGYMSESSTASNPPGPTVVMRCFNVTTSTWTNGPCTVTAGTPARVSWSVPTGGLATTTCETIAGSLWADAPVPKPRARTQLWPPGESTVPMTVLTDTLGIHCKNPTTDWGTTDTVVLNRSNTAPVVSAVTVTHNYCSTPPTVSAGTVGWTYTDANGDAQSAFQIQLRDPNRPTDPPIFDTGKIMSSATTYTLSAGKFSQAYVVRMHAWDTLDASSPWVGSTRWTSPLRNYPKAIINATPITPLVGESVAFTSSSICYNNSNIPVACTSLQWNFGDGATGSGVNVSHMYGAVGAYTVTLSAQDQAPQSFVCSTSIPISVSEASPSPTASPGLPLPQWKEDIPR